MKLGSSNKLAGLLGKQLVKKYDIKNEIIEKVSLPVTVSKNFLETSVAGVKYNKQKTQPEEIFDTALQGRLGDMDKIFYGQRTKQIKIFKEQNFITSFAEH